MRTMGHAVATTEAHIAPILAMAEVPTNGVPATMNERRHRLGDQNDDVTR